MRHVSKVCLRIVVALTMVLSLSNEALVVVWVDVTVETGVSIRERVSFGTR